jgi:F-type H+-transporting ATPase subunit epsilon
MTVQLALRILTPAERLLEITDLRWIQVQLVDGSLGILPGHAPLLAEMAGHELRYANDEGEHCISLEAGILQIRGDTVTVFTGSAVGQEASETPEREEAVSFSRLTGTLLKALQDSGQGL